MDNDYYKKCLNAVVQAGTVAPELSGNINKEIRKIKERFFRIIGENDVLNRNRGFITPGGSAYFLDSGDKLDDSIPYYFYSREVSDSEVNYNSSIISVYAKLIWQTGSPITKLAFNKVDNNYVFEIHSDINNGVFDIRALGVDGVPQKSILLKINLDISKKIERDMESIGAVLSHRNMYVAKKLGSSVVEVHRKYSDELSVLSEFFSHFEGIIRYLNSEVDFSRYYHHQNDVESLFGEDELKNTIITAHALFALSKILNLPYCYLMPSFFVNYKGINMTFGTIILDVEKRLEPEEITLLRIINSDMYKMINTVKMHQLMQVEEWRHIVDSMSHSMKHHFIALSSTIEEKNYAFNWTLNHLKNHNKQQAENSERIYENFKTKVNGVKAQLVETNSVLFALMKIKGDRTNLKGQGTDVQETLMVTRQGIDLVLLEVIDVLKYSLSGLGFATDRNTTSIKDGVLPNLDRGIRERFQGLSFYCCVPLLRIVLMDLLKNAIKYTDPFVPYLEVDMEDRDGVIRILIKNNQSITKEEFDYINGYSLEVKGATSLRVGIKTVRGILNYNGIGQSGKTWRLGALKSSIDPALKMTTVFIDIPKDEFYEEE